MPPHPQRVWWIRHPSNSIVGHERFKSGISCETCFFNVVHHSFSQPKIGSLITSDYAGYASTRNKSVKGSDKRLC
uniref:Ovule protein n=1 Tax=Heterorhabditis bacteriophora TaxID=37862 RepID=A0A1I7WFQ2_HETBA